MKVREAEKKKQVAYLMSLDGRTGIQRVVKAKNIA